MNKVGNYVFMKLCSVSLCRFHSVSVIISSLPPSQGVFLAFSHLCYVDISSSILGPPHLILHFIAAFLPTVMASTIASLPVTFSFYLHFSPTSRISIQFELLQLYLFGNSLGSLNYLCPKFSSYFPPLIWMDLFHNPHLIHLVGWYKNMEVTLTLPFP